MKKVYSTTQREYLQAKKVFEEASKVLEGRIQKLSVIREVQQNEMEQLVVETGFHDSFTKLTDAENRLIDWSHTAIQEEKIYKENRAQFDNMFANLHSNLEARTTIIDLALKIK